jgi:leucyl-tRNA synthetase
MKQYNPKEIEPKWQKWWINNNTYVADLNSKKPKYMASGMFNYPSGDGIHVGHAYTFTIPDVLARYKRQQGFESFNPVGWDSFGLPAENYAIKLGISPQESIPKCIEYYQRQYTAMGWGVDWTKEIDSSQLLYYKWT